MKQVDCLEKWMRMYYDFGWYSIPCFLEISRHHYGDEKKHPDFGRRADGKMRKWQTFVPQLPHMIEDLHTFKTYRLGSKPNALAILTGKLSNLLVLDCDDDDICMKFLNKLGIKIYADSYSVATQSGKGSQIYFKWDDRLSGIKTTLSKFFGKDVPMDIRGDGGLVFCPPSQVRNFDNDTVRHYRLAVLENGRKMKVHGPPENLVKFLLVRAAERESRGSLNSSTCTRHMNELTEKQAAVFYKVTNELKEAVVGARSERCFATLCTFIKFQITPDDAWSVVKGLSKFAERDRKYFDEMWTNALGYVGDDEHIKGTPPSSPLQKAANIIFRPTAKDFLSYKPKRIVPEIIGYPFFRRASLSMFCGDPSVGKTTMALQLVKAAAVGEKCWDGQIEFEDPLKILMFHGDLNSAVFEKQYLSKIGMSLDHPRVTFQVLSDMQTMINTTTVVDEATGHSVASFELLDPRNYLLYKDFMKEVKPDFVVIDTLTSFLSSDQNDIAAMKKILQFLKNCSSEFEHHCLLIHHARKRSSIDAKSIRNMILDDVRGSSAITALCDFIIGFSNVYDDQATIVKGAGYVHPLKEGSAGAEFSRFENFRYRIVNDHERNGEISIKFGYGEDYPIGIKPKPEDSTLKAVLLYAQEERKSSDIVSKICDEYDVRIRSGEAKLSELRKKGYLTSRADGHYRFYKTGAKGIELLPTVVETLDEFIVKPTVKDLIINRAMEDVMCDEATKLTEDQIRAWYADRMHYDEPATFPVDILEWDTVKDQWTDEQSASCALNIANTLWYRCDKYGNIWYSNLIAILKYETAHDFDLVVQIIKSMIDNDQIWFHAHYDNEKLKDIVLHPSRELERKFIK